MARGGRADRGGATRAGHAADCIQRVDSTSGAVTTVYDACYGRRLFGPNGLVFDMGGFWFTDYGTTTPTGRNCGARYCGKPDRSHFVRARDWLLSPNGVGLSPDGSVVFVADTELGQLWAFDVHVPGLLKPPRGHAPGRVVANMPGYIELDSMAIEAGHVNFPDFLTTNIASVGPTCATPGSPARRPGGSTDAAGRVRASARASTPRA